jgi:hypothetical protein
VKFHGAEIEFREDLSEKKFVSLCYHDKNIVEALEILKPKMSDIEKLNEQLKFLNSVEYNGYILKNGISYQDSIDYHSKRIKEFLSWLREEFHEVREYEAIEDEHIIERMYSALREYIQKEKFAQLEEILAQKSNINTFDDVKMFIELYCGGMESNG